MRGCRLVKPLIRRPNSSSSPDDVDPATVPSSVHPHAWLRVGRGWPVAGEATGHATPSETIGGDTACPHDATLGRSLARNKFQHDGVVNRGRSERGDGALHDPRHFELLEVLAHEHQTEESGTDDEVDEGSRVRAPRELRPSDRPRNDALCLLQVGRPEAVARRGNLCRRIRRSGEEYFEEGTNRRRTNELGALEQEPLEIGP